METYTLKTVQAQEWSREVNLKKALQTVKQNQREKQKHFCSSDLLYGQKPWDTPLNHWIQVFHSSPFPQLDEIKHLAMRSAFENICEGMGYSEEFDKFMRGFVIWPLALALLLLQSLQKRLYVLACTWCLVLREDVTFILTITVGRCQRNHWFGSILRMLLIPWGIIIGLLGHH